MGSKPQGNGTEGPHRAPGDHGYDPDFTANVINSMGDKTNPRLRTVMGSLIKHIHDFAREVDLTTDEWMMGVNMINWAGQMSTDRRNEGQLLCDVIGVESLVDEITYFQATKNGGQATASAILGPFWRTTPVREYGANVSSDTPKDGCVSEGSRARLLACLSC